MPPLLLCCDLDRTLLPNGPQAESDGARTAFRAFVERAEVSLAFATGRSRELVEEALAKYALPEPEYVIGDVGTSIHRVETGRWRDCEDWSDIMAADWAGMSGDDIAGRLRAVDELERQEAGKQNRFKVSYYAPVDVDPGYLSLRTHECLDGSGIAWRTVFSIDEAEDTALFDVLPAAGGKLNALRFLYRRLGLAEEDVLFAGDSGNDVEVLASTIPGVLVANALPEVAWQASAAARANGAGDRLYLARGGFLGMNGNYCAGVLEGAAHYHPHLLAGLDGGAGT